MRRPLKSRRHRRPPTEDQNAQHITKLYSSASGQDFFITGTGTSLMGFDWKRLNGLNTIALNEAVKAPGFVPLYHLFSDQNLYFEGKGGRSVGGYCSFDYNDRTMIVCQRHVRTNFIKSSVSDNLKSRIYQFHIAGTLSITKPGDDHLFIDRTVATGAIMFAWRLGARRIFLLGVDGYKVHLGEGPNRREVYYYDGTTKPKEKRKESFREIEEGRTMIIQDRHQAWQKNMNDLSMHLRASGNPYPSVWPGPGVYNLSEISTISSWVKVELSQALKEVGV